MTNEINKKIQFNIWSSNRYGWEPDFFGAKAFDEDLITKVIGFQFSKKLTADGMVGEKTYAEIKKIRDSLESSNYILFRATKYFVDDLKVSHRLSLEPSSKNQMKYINSFVLHWDVCLNTDSCHSVLKNRGLGVHFGIDNDGLLYQFHDCAYSAYHAGVSSVNNSSIGVEISNAYDIKYQSFYNKNGFGPRPIVTTPVHGQNLEHLGFYPAQMETLTKLTYYLNKIVGIPLVAPCDKNGKECLTMFPDAANGTFKGICNHSHVTSKKIDAGVNISELIQRVMRK